MKKILACLFAASNLFAAAPPANKWDNGGFTATNGCGGSFSGVSTSDLVTLYLYTQSTTISGVNITDGGGGNTWHIIGPINGTGNSSFIGWTVPTNTFASAQWNWTGSTSGDCAGGRYTGMAGVATVLDCSSTGSSGSGTALTSGACTPTAANDLIVAVGGVLQNSATMTAGSGFTMQETDAHSTLGNSYGYEDQNSATCASQAAPMTAGVSGQWSSIMAAFKTSSPTACTTSNTGYLL